MLCPHCGSYADEKDVLCPGCGALLSQEDGEEREEGVRAIRQGRRDKTPPAAARHASAGKAGASRIYVDASARDTGREAPLYADPQVFNADGTPLATGYDRPAKTL